MSQGNDFYIVKNRETLAKLPEWLRTRDYTTFRDGFTDVNGKPMVGLQKNGKKAGLILILDDSQEGAVIEAVHGGQRVDVRDNADLPRNGHDVA